MNDFNFGADTAVKDQLTQPHQRLNRVIALAGLAVIGALATAVAHSRKDRAGKTPALKKK